MDSLSLKLCDIQGRLFELAAKNKYDSEKFVSFFMSSEVAKALDSKYNRMQWAGEEYLLEELLAESNGRIPTGDTPASSEAMYWVGYVYRYWHYYKNESSSKIYHQANFKTLKRNYLNFHTMDPQLAIDDLMEIGRGPDKGLVSARGFSRGPDKGLKSDVDRVRDKKVQKELSPLHQKVQKEPSPLHL